MVNNQKEDKSGVKVSPINKLAIVLVIIVLLPVLIYTTYEFNTLSENESLIAEIYDQQLEAILYSVNQYTWDFVNNWVAEFEKYRLSSDPHSITKVFSNDETIIMSGEVDSTLSQYSILYSKDKASEQVNGNLVIFELQKQDAKLIGKLKELKKQGYKKIETTLINNSDDSEIDKILFVFIPDNFSKHGQLGFILAQSRGIINIISKKLTSVASDQFKVGIFKNSQQNPIYSNEPFQLNEVKQRKNIWIFPDYFLGISMRGESIEQVLRSRFMYSLALILFVDVLLLVGVWFIFRTMKKEFALTKLKTDFVSNVSHELRTPLALIKMYAETLEMNRVASEEKRNSYYKIIHQEAERLTRLINNILNFSRIESGKKQYAFRQIDLNKTVNNIVEIYQFHLQNQGFALKLNVDNGELPINADEEAVTEALINLMDNAIKYSDDEKEISISTGRQNGNVLLKVKDSGIGINKENQKYIFDKFYRVSSGSTFTKKGSGLGLSLVKHIMDAHGGEILLESTPGKGSTFTLVFNNIQKNL